MRILIVEDEHRIATTLKKGLEQERYTVDVRYDGIQGYDLASSESFELILLDLMLPGMDGMTLCKKLRSANIHTPILMLTAKSQIPDKVSGLDAGADDYLSKPFSFEELLARIRALIRRPAQTVQALLRVKDLSLDSKTYEVKRAEHHISLSSREFMLLEFLMRNARRIMTKDQIIEHVWNYDADILHNTIEVYIKNLRRKVDEPFKSKPALIHTVRGFGYKLE